MLLVSFIFTFADKERNMDELLINFTVTVCPRRRTESPLVVQPVWLDVQRLAAGEPIRGIALFTGSVERKCSIIFCQWRPEAELPVQQLLHSWNERQRQQSVNINVESKLVPCPPETVTVCQCVKCILTLLVDIFRANLVQLVASEMFPSSMWHCGSNNKCYCIYTDVRCTLTAGLQLPSITSQYITNHNTGTSVQYI